MKKLLLISSFLIAAITVNAQTTAAQTRSERSANGPAEKATQQTNSLDKAVTLTTDQKEKAYTINLQLNEALKTAAQNKANFEDEKKRIKTEREKNIMAILTAEQQAKFTKALADKRAAKSAENKK
ncbi:MAG: hypothetical protein K0S44_1533 [Bacteroidetes bacterium]|jgi:Spy/CpxP family protein refolding chaperone|nr:hypothetical protein [Bacteroidota bacterium]